MTEAAAATRDRAVRRLRRLNRAIVAATAVLVGAFADVAARAFPGHTAARPAATPSATARAATHHRRQRKHDAPVRTATRAPTSTTTPPAATTPSGERPPRVATAPTSAADLAPPAAPPVIAQAPAQTTSGGS